MVPARRVVSITVGDDGAMRIASAATNRERFDAWMALGCVLSQDERVPESIRRVIGQLLAVFFEKPEDAPRAIKDYLRRVVTSDLGADGEG
jgi:hypothetical protein